MGGFPRLEVGAEIRCKWATNGLGLVEPFSWKNHNARNLLKIIALYT